MPTIKLQQVKNFDKLLKYLETELGWPVEGREIDDIAFPFDLESDLGLDKNEVAKVRHVYRLKKMHKKQPFGIFFVDFEGKKMPVSVLKRILRNLALKRKANAKAADQLAWDVEDLIFISAVGEEKDSTREISFAHFRKEPDNRHVLKVMAWDGGDTPLKMEHLDDVLHEFLRFPDDTNDVDAWRKSWTAAFRTGLRQNIRRSEELAQALAALAMRINKEALSLIKKESANGPLKTLHAGFKEALIHDLTEEAFTDCYAQTITYGLLTAAITKVNQAGVKDLTSTSVLEMVPSTNPFLKDILSSFLEAGGRGEKGIDFDDLGVQDVIDLLRAESTDLPNILRDFGNLTQDEDPVIHFYETFLKIYNKDERVKRGAFYTPRPVVSYIVRSVDELLRKEFGLEDGLADTTTWGEMIKRNPAIKLPPLTDNSGEKKTIKETEPFVQILDPATGTATFLVEVINIIEKTVKAKAWAKLKNGPYDHDQHSKREEVLKTWNEYVPEHLLKRLHAYELMMAPYVIAHMKVGLKLAETGYRFATEERARIFLTNALEPAKEFKERLNFDIPALAIEAKQVNEVKHGKRFTVVIGNPPYSGESTNNSQWITSMIRDYHTIDGQPLGEANPRWLQDDYVKFIRLTQQAVGISGRGIVSMITNNAFLDNATFRGARQSLLKSFSHVKVLDLHGNTKKKERHPDGSVDMNVFEIQQGVSVSILVKEPLISGKKIEHAEIYGTREIKYSFLRVSTSSNTKWNSINPISPFYLLIPQDQTLFSEYQAFSKITDIMPVHSNGIVTARDHLCISWTQEEALEVVKKFAEMKPEEARKNFELGDDSRDWQVKLAQADARQEGPSRKLITEIYYRPFDTRWTYFTGRSRGFLCMPRGETMANMLSGKNVALITSRMTKGESFHHVQATRSISEAIVMSPKSSNNGFIFPLYLMPEQGEAGLLELRSQPEPNLTPEFLRKLVKALNSDQDEEEVIPAYKRPEEVFCYIYAVLHSAGYRERYAEFLKIDFPRLPLPAGKKLFSALAKLGQELLSLHLFDAPEQDEPIAEFLGGNQAKVESISWSNKTVWLDKALSAGFRGVKEEVWKFNIGGYQVCEKWLKDRRGRVLSKSDIKHYRMIIQTVTETIKVMSAIERAIDAHGGWPKAFQ